MFGTPPVGGLLKGRKKAINYPPPTIAHIFTRLFHRVMRASTGTESVARPGKAWIKNRTHHPIRMLPRSTTASVNCVVPGPVTSSPAVMLDAPIGLTREFRPLLPQGALGFSSLCCCVSFTIEAKIPFQDYLFHLAMDTLAVRLAVPLTGPVEDFHFLGVRPAGRTNKKSQQ